MEVRERAFRDAAGHYPTGVAIVAARHEGRPCGLTVNSFATVSLDPPLVLVCLAKAARSYGCIEAAGTFALSVLAEGQEDLARLFSSDAEDKFRGLAISDSPSGNPIVGGAHAWLEGEVVGRQPGGRTHTILLARVTAAGTAPAGAPLVFYRGSFVRLATATSHA